MLSSVSLEATQYFYPHETPSRFGLLHSDNQQNFDSWIYNSLILYWTVLCQKEQVLGMMGVDILRKTGEE